MTIRYEANPPKISSDAESMKKFIDKIKIISKKCDAIHLTENVLGFQRESPIKAGRQIREILPDLPITVSLRVRDKDENKVIEFVKECIESKFNGILVLLGDPPQSGEKDSGLIPSKTAKMLKERFGSEINFYLSISNEPDLAKIRSKIMAKPDGFMTQVVHNLDQVQNLKDILKIPIIPIMLYPSAKNARSAEFLGIDLKEYSKDFKKFVTETRKITKDVLLTSPSDFVGLSEFLDTI